MNELNNSNNTMSNNNINKINKTQYKKTLIELNPQRVRFPEIIKTFGFILKTYDCTLETNVELRNNINVDQNEFITEMEMFLNKKENSLIKQEFLDSMQFIILSFNERQLSLCCQPSISSDLCPFSLRGQIQDSLFQILLNCRTLQPCLLQVLMQKLRQVFLEFKDERISSKKISLASQIFHQFRCAVHIEDSQLFLSQLIQIIPDAPVVIQKDIINIIPNFIVSLSEMDKEIVDKLEDLMEETNLQSNILQALSQLSPLDEHIDRFVQKTYEKLAEAPIDSLPTMVNFLLQYSSNADECTLFLLEIEKVVESVIDTIQTMDPNIVNERCSSVMYLLHSTPQRNQRNENITLKKHSSIIGEIIDHVIKAARSNANRKLVIDCIVCLLQSNYGTFTIYRTFLAISIMSRVKSSIKSFDRILTLKVKENFLTDLQISSLLSTFNEFFVQNPKLFKTLLDFARNHLRERNAEVREFVTCLYKRLFTSMTKEISMQRDVVDALICSHIFSTANSQESDYAFDILTQLTEENMDQMEKHHYSLTLLTKHLDVFNDAQVLKTFRCLTLASFKSPIFLKQVSKKLAYLLRNSKSNQQAYGIIGLIAFMSCGFRNLKGNTAGHNANIEENGKEYSLEENFNQTCMGLFNTVVDLKTSAQKSCLPFFCDTLADHVWSTNTPLHVLDTIETEMKTLFTNQFLLETSEKGSSSSASSSNTAAAAAAIIATATTYAYGIEGRSNNSITTAINLASSNKDLLFPLFRVICVTERKIHKQEEMGNLSTFLSCHVFANVPEAAFSKKIQWKWLTLNWFREVVNGFSSVKSKKNLEYLFSRLDTCAFLNDEIFEKIKKREASLKQLCTLFYDINTSRFQGQQASQNRIKRTLNDCVKKNKKTKKEKKRQGKEKKACALTKATTSQNQTENHEFIEIEEVHDEIDDDESTYCLEENNESEHNVHDEDGTVVEENNDGDDFYDTFDDESESLYEFQSKNKKNMKKKGEVNDDDVDGEDEEKGDANDDNDTTTSTITQDDGNNLSNSINNPSQKLIMQVKDPESKSYFKCLRPFEWETYFILKYCCKNNLGILVSTSVKLYILKDLYNKLSSTVVQISTKTVKILKPFNISRIASFITRIIPVLQALMQQLDELEDTLPLLMRCTHLLLLLLHNQDEVLVNKVLEGVTRTKDNKGFLVLFNSFQGLKLRITRMEDAIVYLKLQRSILYLCPENVEEAEIALSQDSFHFLAYSWSNYSNKDLCQLLEMCFDCNGPLTDTVQNIGRNFLLSFFTESELVRMVELVTEGDTSTIIEANHRVGPYPCFTMETFPVIYGTLLKNFRNAIKEIPLVHRVNGDKEKVPTDVLELLQSITCFFHLFLLSMRCFESTKILKVSLQRGKEFLHQLQRRALPTMKTCLKHYKIKSIQLLSEVQRVTTFLQRLCSTSRIKNEPCLLQQVPIIRKKLSELLYECKAVLSENQCQDLVSIGVLKAKDIFGRNIHTLSKLAWIHESKESFIKRRRSRIINFTPMDSDLDHSSNDDNVNHNNTNNDMDDDIENADDEEALYQDSYQSSFLQRKRRKRQSTESTNFEANEAFDVSAEIELTDMEPDDDV